MFPLLMITCLSLQGRNDIPMSSLDEGRLCLKASYTRVHTVVFPFENSYTRYLQNSYFWQRGKFGDFYERLKSSQTSLFRTYAH